MSDLRSKILEMDDIEREVIPVPMWDDVEVEIVGLSGRERGKMLKRVMDRKTGEVDYEALYPALLIATVHNPETGQKLFEESDMGPLNNKSGAALEYIGEKAMELSGMKEETVNDLGKLSSEDTTSSIPTGE